MGTEFRGIVRRAFPMGERRALLLDTRYEGDVEAGDWIEVPLPSGRTEPVQVVQLAWGSAFRADSPPLTLVVDGLEEELPSEGTEIRGVEAPG